jgi:hypothetical protein
MDGLFALRCLVLKTGRGHECQTVGYPAGLTVCPRDGGLDKTLNIDFQASPTPFPAPECRCCRCSGRGENREICFSRKCGEGSPRADRQHCFLTSFDRLRYLNISGLSATDSKIVSDRRLRVVEAVFPRIQMLLAVFDVCVNKADSADHSHH